MPRRKAPAPARLGEGEREANTWRMGESSSAAAGNSSAATEQAVSWREGGDIGLFIH